MPGSASKFFPHMSAKKLQELSESCNFDFDNGTYDVAPALPASIYLYYLFLSQSSLSLLFPVFVIPSLPDLNVVCEFLASAIVLSQLSLGHE